MSRGQDIALSLEFDETQPLPEWHPGGPLIEAGVQPTVFELTIPYEEAADIAVIGMCLICHFEEVYINRDGLCRACLIEPQQ